MRTCLMSLAALCALSFVTPAAHADPMIGAEVFGALNTYAMGDVNDVIDIANDLVGTNFDKISARLGGGLGPRLWLTPNWMLDVVWEPLFAKSESDAYGAAGTYDLGGNSFQMGTGYFVPTGTNGRVGFGAGLGYYSVSGEASDDSSSVDIQGSTVGFHVMGLGEWTVSPGFSVHATVGYRMAKIDDTEYDGEKTPLETDYSGLLARVGLALYLPGNR